MDSDDETGSDVSVKPWQPADVDHFIRHATVRQLLEADQMHSTAPFKIEGKEFKKFILVANICHLDEQKTYRDIGLDDGTGRIKAREWNDNQEIGNKSGGFQVSDFPYVRVVGELEQFRNRNMVKVMNIEAVLSAYEPYYHVLHAVHDTLVYERGPPPVNVSETTFRGVPEVDALDGDWGGEPSTDHDPSSSSEPHSRAASTLHLSYTPDSNHHEGLRSTGSSSGSHKESVPQRNTSHQRSNAQVQRLTEDTASLSLVPRPSPSSIISSSSQQPRRSLRKHDPYSSLTTLERDIILCIKTAATQHRKESIYPHIGSLQSRETAWKGLQLSDIIRVLSSQRPNMGPEELHDAFEHLIDESYVFSPVDEDYFDCI